MSEIAEVAGIEIAWEIVRAMGGRIVYIPASVNDGHWLVELVGLDAAQKICKFYAANNSGFRILIPMAKQIAQKERLVKALEAGSSAPEAARVANMHVRSAYRARSKARKKDKSQGNLF